MAGAGAAALSKPNENPELAVVIVAATGLIDPNSVELVAAVVVAVSEPLSTVAVAAIEGVAPPNETPAKRLPAEEEVEVVGLQLPKRPVPGAMVAVEAVPKIVVDDVAVLVTEANRVDGLVVTVEASGFAWSDF